MTAKMNVMPQKHCSAGHLFTYSTSHFRFLSAILCNSVTAWWFYR